MTHEPAVSGKRLVKVLETTGWDKKSQPPQLPEEVVERTAAKYREALEKLTDVHGR